MIVSRDKFQTKEYQKSNHETHYDCSKMKAIFWDTCGQERYRSVAHSFFRGAGVVILVYDSTNEDSFDNIRTNWARDLETHLGAASKAISRSKVVVVLLQGYKHFMLSYRT